MKTQKNKTFYTQDNIGLAKYTVSFYDGISKYNDGSDFYDIKLFKNKEKLNTFINELIKNGYKKR